MGKVALVTEPELDSSGLRSGELLFFLSFSPSFFFDCCCCHFLLTLARVGDHSDRGRSRVRAAPTVKGWPGQAEKANWPGQWELVSHAGSAEEAMGKPTRAWVLEGVQDSVQGLNGIFTIF